MQARTLVLAALVALAATACETTPDAGDDATGATSVSSASADANQGSSAPDDTLHDRVHDALMEQMGPRVNDVGVKTDGSKVILTGSVATAADKKQAHDIAHGVRGVTVVDDSALVVKP
jgi:osmotically-inducible protein OsmY